MIWPDFVDQMAQLILPAHCFECCVQAPFLKYKLPAIAAMPPLLLAVTIVEQRRQRTRKKSSALQLHLSGPQEAEDVGNDNAQLHIYEAGTVQASASSPRSLRPAVSATEPQEDLAWEATGHNVNHEALASETSRSAISRGESPGEQGSPSGIEVEFDAGDVDLGRISATTSLAAVASTTDADPVMLQPRFPLKQNGDVKAMEQTNGLASAGGSHASSLDAHDNKTLTPVQPGSAKGNGQVAGAAMEFSPTAPGQDNSVNSQTNRSEEHTGAGHRSEPASAQSNGTTKVLIEYQFQLHSQYLVGWVGTLLMSYRSLQCLCQLEYCSKITSRCHWP